MKTWDEITNEIDEVITKAKNTVIWALDDRSMEHAERAAYILEVAVGLRQKIKP